MLGARQWRMEDCRDDSEKPDEDAVNSGIGEGGRTDGGRKRRSWENVCGVKIELLVGGGREGARGVRDKVEGVNKKSEIRGERGARRCGTEVERAWEKEV